jgi:argininosuccinate lyase
MKISKNNRKLWGGRFQKPTDPDMEVLSHSLSFDKKLYKEDIQGSLSHAKALVQSGVLNISEFKKVSVCLKKLERDIRNNPEILSSADEDVHMAIESILIERIGDLGKKLHTGRSRNDQVATDFRLYCRNQCQCIGSLISDLQAAVLQKSKEYLGTIMAGYTHLQQAQPIYISHYLLSLFWALERDKSRVQHSYKSSGQMPLGAGALAGSAFPYDRLSIARELGFDRPGENSIDVTAHRDFALELLSTLAILGSLLSRYAEDFVIWSSNEFNYLDLGDAFSTGSSMMPQKRNPDSMELIRGKTGRLLGNFTALLTTVKGAPLCYSRDLQEDKEPVFDSVETIKICLKVMAKSIASMKFNLEDIDRKMDTSILATDIADLLVKQGVPFR